MSKTFSAPYTSTTLMCFMGFIECGIIAAIFKPVISAWSLSNPMWLLAALYTVCFTSLDLLKTICRISVSILSFFGTRNTQFPGLGNSLQRKPS